MKKSYACVAALSVFMLALPVSAKGIHLPERDVFQSEIGATHDRKLWVPDLSDLQSGPEERGFDAKRVWESLFPGVHRPEGTFQPRNFMAPPSSSDTFDNFYRDAQRELQSDPSAPVPEEKVMPNLLRLPF